MFNCLYPCAGVFASNQLLPSCFPAAIQQLPAAVPTGQKLAESSWRLRPCVSRRDLAAWKWEAEVRLADTRPPAAPPTWPRRPRTSPWRMNEWINVDFSEFVSCPPTSLSSSHCINSPPLHLRLFFISSSCWKSPHHLVLPVVCLWIVYLLLLIYFYSARSTKYWLHFKPMQWPKNLSLPDIKNHIISLVICFYFILLLLF